MLLSLVVALFLAVTLGVDAAQPKPMTKPRAGKTAQMVTISGECTKLTHAGLSVEGCKAILMNMNYSTGVSGYWFMTGNSILSFAGESARRIEQGSGNAVQSIERVFLADPSNIGQADDTAAEAAIGFCRFGDVSRPLLQSLNEAATWGALRHHGLMANTVVVSDDARQFRVATHSLCWVHAERHLEKLMPASPKQAKAVELVREAIWCFYRSLKLWKQSPSLGGERAFRWQFDRIFGQRTGYQELDELLARLARHKAELLLVLERPELSLHTNASENDLRACVIKRKISGGTMSADGRVARDGMLGLSKTGRKLGLSFFAYTGDRLGLDTGQPRIPPLADLVIRAA